MPKVIYIQPNGEQREIDVPEGTSLMQGAMMGGIDGIVAECGGSAMCATCHVYVDEEYLSATGEVDDVEHEMLECAASERKANSRLSCQVISNDSINGIIVKIPVNQV